MLKVMLDKPSFYGDVPGCFQCPACLKIMHFTMLHGKLIKQIPDNCICGEKLPLIESMLTWSDVRARYHIHNSEQERTC